MGAPWANWVRFSFRVNTCADGEYVAFETPAARHGKAGEPGERDAAMDKLAKTMTAKGGRRFAVGDGEGERMFAGIDLR